MSTTTEEFIIDPFASDINPGTATGQKLFLQACAEVKDSEKLTATVEKQHVVMEEITALVQRFCWGTQILAIKLASDLSTTKSLLTENHDLSVNDLKLQAYKIWGGGANTATEIPVNTTTSRRDLILTPITITASSTNDEKKVFFMRVRSTMIRKAIEGRFCKKTLKNIRLYRRHYEWRNLSTGELQQDGATMLKILMDILKPSLKIGLKEYKNVLKNANGKKYQNNVIEMLDVMEAAYDEITVTHGKTYDSYMEDLFSSLKTFPNRLFTDYVIRIEDDWEADNTNDLDDIDELILKVRTKFNNMVNSEKWDYVDPADAKIMALTTSLDDVKKQLEEEKAKNTTSKDKKQNPPFDERRCKFAGDKITLDGVQYDWCNKGHKSHASPDGMYMPAGHNHDQWLENRKQRGYTRNRSNTSSTSSSAVRGAAANKKMILAEKMQAALVTKCGFSNDEAEAFLNDDSLKE